MSAPEKRPPSYLLLPSQAVASHRPHVGDDAVTHGTARKLLDMARLGLPVPEALLIDPGGEPDGGPRPLAGWGLPALEKITGRRLGDPLQPLIVAVRSGTPMPGMPDTLLNIGLSERTAGGLLRQTGNPRLVWDALRKLVAAFGVAVAGVPAERFEQALRSLADGRNEHELDFAEHRRLWQTNLGLYQRHTGQPFPQDPYEQLKAAVRSMFRAWQAPSAAAHRRRHGLADAPDPAVIVQRMVFGSTGRHLGCGVAFTRDPSTGEPGLWLDEPGPVQDRVGKAGSCPAHGDAPPPTSEVWHTLRAAAHTLERHFRDMQEIGFIVEDGALYLLQTRAGPRSPQATARIALDLWREGLIDTPTALARTAHLRPQDLNDTRRTETEPPRLEPDATLSPRLAVLRGRTPTGGSPGASPWVGQIGDPPPARPRDLKG